MAHSSNRLLTCGGGRRFATVDRDVITSRNHRDLEADRRVSSETGVSTGLTPLAPEQRLSRLVTKKIQHGSISHGG